MIGLRESIHKPKDWLTMLIDAIIKTLRVVKQFGLDICRKILTYLFWLGSLNKMSFPNPPALVLRRSADICKHP
jgi:hypothetical protein